MATPSGRVATRVIWGSPQSKSNSRRIIHKKIRGRSRTLSIKSVAAMEYAHAFREQCKPEPVLLSGDLELTVKIKYRSWQSDLDESLIMDLLQGLIYHNDRQIKIKHIYHEGTDQEAPYAHITVRELEG